MNYNQIGMVHKNKFYKKFLIFTLLSLISNIALGVDVTYNGLSYSVDTSAKAATCEGLSLGVTASGDLVIPDYIIYNGEQYPVTRIGEYAFDNCSGFTGSLTIGNSVRTIGEYAFDNCSGFRESLTIPDSVTEIGNMAFFNCSGFTGSLTIGNSVTTIGVGAFYECSGFTGSLTIPGSVTEIGDYAFSWCSGFTGSLTIPGSVTEIGDYAFSWCSGFTGSLTIPNSVTTIGDVAFSWCSGFTGSLTIGNSVTKIGSQAFSDCSGFTGSLTIPDSVTSIGEWAFSGCSGFTGSLTIGNSVTEIGDYAFSWCSGFTGSLTIPNSVTTIGTGAFANCSGFTGSLTIGNSVITIGNSAFQDCSGFTGSLTIGNSVTTIGNYAFYECSGFTGSLTIPDSVTEIGNYAFFFCNGFTGSLTIPASVTSIGEYAFSYCNGFTGSLTIPASVTSIGEYAFSYCTGFTGSLTIPDSVTSIEKYAFSYCSGFTGSLTIPASVTSIGEMAFAYCARFTGSLTIPDSVTSIGEWVFACCYGFTGSLTIPDSVTTIGEYAFYNCSGFTGSLTIGNSVTTIGEYAFYNCSGFTGSLTLGNSVIEIGGYAFYNIYNINFEKIKSLNPTPPKASSESFPSYQVPLYVPVESISLYKNAEIWRNFKSINSISDNENIEVQSITLNHTSVELNTGETFKLTATVSPENATDKTVIWKSDNEEIATVAADGTVTGVSVGSAIITATSGNVSASCKVTVNPSGTTTIMLNAQELSLTIGQQEKLIATIYPVDPVEKTITWKSDNEGVATVGADGTVTAVSVGTANITATYGNVSASCKVTVNPITVTGITIDPSYVSLLRGESCQFTATISPATAETVLSWSSSASSIVDVNSDGVATAIEPGIAMIYAQAENGVTGLAMVYVVDNGIVSIDIIPDVVTLEIGETIPLSVQIIPSTTSSYIVWSSSKPQIATVDDKGVVKGVGQGSAVIYATAENGIRGTAVVNVMGSHSDDDNPNYGYGEDGIYVSAVKIREGNSLGLYAERPVGFQNNDWSYEWYHDGELEAKGKNVTVTAGKSSGWEGTVKVIDTERYQAEISNSVGDVVLLETPEISVYSRPLTPLGLERKGNGTSHTFIAMSQLSDSDLAKSDYSFVFGYTDKDGISHSISNSGLRYCHTTKEIYDDVDNRFWVYTNWTFPDGATITSGIRYLDGTLDESFDRSDFNTGIRSGIGLIEEETETSIYTIEGHYVGKETSRLTPGFYIIRESNGQRLSTRKIIIK